MKISKRCRSLFKTYGTPVLNSLGCFMISSNPKLYPYISPALMDEDDEDLTQTIFGYQGHLLLGLGVIWSDDDDCDGDGMFTINAYIDAFALEEHIEDCMIFRILTKQ